MAFEGFLFFFSFNFESNLNQLLCHNKLRFHKMWKKLRKNNKTDIMSKEVWP